jgi:hypothetical protein
MAKRSSIREDAEKIDRSFQTFDLSQFTPEISDSNSDFDVEKLREISASRNFPSREPQPRPEIPPKAAKPRREPRIYKTGRNVQFNVKASQTTIDAFYAISNQQGWVLGETLEHALAALRRELEGQGRGH